jgi:TPR repeat protein
MSLHKTALSLYNQGEYLQALEIWQKESHDENPQAFTNIGLLYLKGEGVTQDVQKAKEYFVQGALFNNPSSLFNLATMYQNHIGFEQDEQKAIDLFKQAAALKHEGAAFRLALLFLKDKSNTELLKEGFSYMVKAAKYNSLMAKIQLKGFNKEVVSVEKNMRFLQSHEKEQKALIEDTLNRYVRPILKNDGGDIVLVESFNEEAYYELRLVYTGNCEGCSLASSSTYDLIHKTFSDVLKTPLKVLII